MTAISSSFVDFLAAGVRPRTPLTKAIVLALVLKLIVIAGMKIFIFPDAVQPIVDATMMARVLGVSAASN